MSAAWLLVALAALWAAYAYVGYPLALALLTRVAPRRVRRGDAAPSVSIVIAVHNGARELAAKLEHTLALEYPRPFEVIVSSDGSSDGSERIASGFADRGVIVLHTQERCGKEAAQQRAIACAAGEVLVFTDVSARLEPGALRELVRPFADPTVGCVSSEDVVESSGGEGLYVRYEMALRRLESEATSLVGLSGSCFAARRALCDPWPAELASDFRTALEAARRGLRAVSEPRARARFPAADDPSGEWRRKVRTVQRGLAVLAAYRDLLHPRNGRAAVSLWGHKVARFTVPFALLALFAASAVASHESVAAGLLLVGQAAFYAAGAAGLALRGRAQPLPLRVASFFVLTNASILAAWRRHLAGERAIVWQPTERPVR